MDCLTNEDFIEFLESFKKDNFCTITEISKPENSNQSLVVNNFRMYCFDEMCKKYSIIKDNLPKSMDALHYEIDENNRLTLYLIEFKTFNIEGNKSSYTQIEALHEKFKKLNKKTFEYSDTPILTNATLKKFENIKDYFVDSVEFDLTMKPFETLFVAIPWIYEEYCKNNPDVTKKDIRRYLNNIDIKLVVFINRYAPNVNVSANRFSAHHIDNKLKSVYNRLYLSGVIVDDNERILSGDRFNYFIKKQHLTEK